MGDLAPYIVPGGVVGVMAVLVVVIGYLLNANRNDRTQALTTIAAAEGRADAAEKRADDAEERERVSQKRLDDEREKRRSVEDQLGQVLLEIRQLKFKVAHFETELAKYVAGGGGQ